MPDQEWIVGDMRSLALASDLATYWLGIASFISGTRTRDDVWHFCPARRARRYFDVQNRLWSWRSSGSYRGDPLYHASLDASEYEALLADSGFELIEHSVNDPAKGGRIFWLARAVH
jgi:hypothetical protein